VSLPVEVEMTYSTLDCDSGRWRLWNESQAARGFNATGHVTVTSSA